MLSEVRWGGGGSGRDETIRLILCQPQVCLLRLSFKLSVKLYPNFLSINEFIWLITISIKTLYWRTTKRWVSQPGLTCMHYWSCKLLKQDSDPLYSWLNYIFYNILFFLCINETKSLHILIITIDATRIKSATWIKVTLFWKLCPHSSNCLYICTISNQQWT